MRRNPQSKTAVNQKEIQHDIGLIDDKEYKNFKVNITDEVIEEVQKLKRERFSTKEITVITKLSTKEIKQILKEYGEFSVKDRIDQIIRSSDNANKYIFDRCGFEPDELAVLAKAKQMWTKKTNKATITLNTNEAYSLLPLARSAVKEMLTDSDLKFKALGVQMLTKAWDNVLTADCDVSEMKENTNDMAHKILKKKLEDGDDNEDVIPIQVVKLEGKFIEDDSEFERKIKNRQLLLENASQSDSTNSRESTKTQENIP